MTKISKIGLIGDYNDKVVAHRAIPLALELAAKHHKTEVTWEWLATSALTTDVNELNRFSAIWITPGSPYANMEGVLQTIRFARETKKPLLGTCGGFQHTLIEYARNVCQIVDADHAETASEKSSLIVTPLACSLREKTGTITFLKGTQLYKIYEGKSAEEGYYCNYGLNAQWKSKLEKSGLYFSGFDPESEVRAFELPSHPFFIGVLFQPERSALQERYHPLIQAFVEAAILAKIISNEKPI